MRTLEAEEALLALGALLAAGLGHGAQTLDCSQTVGFFVGVMLPGYQMRSHHVKRLLVL